MEGLSALHGVDVHVPKDGESSLIHRTFEKLLRDDPNIANSVAITFKNRSITFTELNQRANRFARCLQEQITNSQRVNNKINNKNKVIGVCLAPSDNLVSLLLAIFKLEAAYVPLDCNFPRSRMSHILKESNPLIVITNQANVSNISDSWDGPVLSYESLSKASDHYCSSNIPDEDEKPDGSLTSMVLFTSGSTGVPKGVVLRHSSVLNRLNWQWKTFPFTNDEVCCFKSVLTFVDSVAEIFAPLLLGKHLVVIPREDVQNTQALVTTLEQHGIERLVAVPSLIRAIFLYMRMHPEKIHLSDLRMVVSSGEPLSVELLQEFFQMFPKGKTLANFYGSTEVMADVLYEIFESPKDIADKVDGSKVPIGIPVINTTAYVLDEQRQTVPIGTVGEIYISGEFVGRYLNENSGQNDRFIANHCSSKAGHSTLYRTGDFGKIHNGMMFYEGRTDSQIKIRGQRVDLSEIEYALLALPGVSAGIVLCYHLLKPDQTVLAFYQAEKNGKNVLSETKVTENLYKVLVPYMVPLVIHKETFPLLHNGKIDRQTLLHEFESERTATQPAIDLWGVEEEHLHAATILLNTIGSVLGVSQRIPLTIGSSFFAVGGNSLNAIVTISQLMDHGYSIAIADFLQSSTLRDVIHKMKFTGTSNSTIQKDQTVQKKYRAVPVTALSKHAIFDIMACSFVNKGDLESYTHASPEEFIQFVEQLWQTMVKSGASFGVMDASDGLVGVALNTNLEDEPAELTLPYRMEIVAEFLDHIEQPHHHKLVEQKVKTMHGLMMGTSQQLNSAENIQLIQFMEEENLRTAKRLDFDAILTVNTSRLTQDICGKLMDYKILSSIQLNSYQDSRGNRPFAVAPDDHRVQVAVKFLK